MINRQQCLAYTHRVWLFDPGKKGFLFWTWCFRESHCLPWLHLFMQDKVSKNWRAVPIQSLSYAPSLVTWISRFLHPNGHEPASISSFICSKAQIFPSVLNSQGMKAAQGHLSARDLIWICGKIQPHCTLLRPLTLWDRAGEGTGRGPGLWALEQALPVAPLFRHEAPMYQRILNLKILPEGIFFKVRG